MNIFTKKIILLLCLATTVDMKADTLDQTNYIDMDSQNESDLIERLDALSLANFFGIASGTASSKSLNARIFNKLFGQQGEAKLSPAQWNLIYSGMVMNLLNQFKGSNSTIQINDYKGAPQTIDLGGALALKSSLSLDKPMVQKAYKRAWFINLKALVKTYSDVNNLKSVLNVLNAQYLIVNDVLTLQGRQDIRIDFDQEDLNALTSLGMYVKHKMAQMQQAQNTTNQSGSGNVTQERKGPVKMDMNLVRRMNEFYRKLNANDLNNDIEAADQDETRPESTQESVDNNAQNLSSEPATVREFLIEAFAKISKKSKGERSLQRKIKKQSATESDQMKAFDILLKKNKVQAIDLLTKLYEHKQISVPKLNRKSSKTLDNMFASFLKAENK